MSGDVQPRKRKDKRKKKDEEEAVPHQASASSNTPSPTSNVDEVIHIHKDSMLGGNMISKIVFFCLLGALGVMVGLILIEYHGSSDVDTQSAENSPWSMMLEGWVETGPDEHDAEHSKQEDDNHDEHDEHEFSEDEHGAEDEHEHEHEEEDTSFFSQQTYDDLKAVYNKITLEESDTEPVSEPVVEPVVKPELEAVQTGGTESEPEATESEVSEPEVSEPEEEEEEEEEEDPEANPIGQWGSENGHKLLAEEVEDVQTEPEDESEDEVSPKVGGAQSVNDKELKAEGHSHEEIVASSETSRQQDKESQEMYDFAEITNAFDWEIKEELDEAERDLEDNEFLA